MARKPKAPKTVEIFKHDEASRTNIPTAEYQSVVQEEQQTPVPVAYKRRNRDLDPQQVHPKVLVDDLLRRTEADEKATEAQPDLFADSNGLADEAATTEFYQHDANWTNRMILGDSLQVMASLAGSADVKTGGRWVVGGRLVDDFVFHTGRRRVLEKRNATLLSK